MNEELDNGQNQDTLSRWANATSISQVQFDAIQRAAARDKVTFEIVPVDPSRADGPPLYIWQKDHILVRGQANEKTNDELARLGAVVADRVGGGKQLVGENLGTLMRLTNNSADEPTSQIVARLNSLDEHKDRFAVNNLVYVTHTDGANLCPADEPTPPPPNPPSIPYPPVSPGGAGEGVKIVVIDTGMPKDWKINLNYPWLRQPVADEVDGDDEIDTYLDPVTGLIAPHAGHGVFIAGLIRCVAPRATVYVKNTMRWCGAMHEHEVAQTILDVLAKDRPDIISFSAGYMIHDFLGGGPGPMVDVMRKLGEDTCQTLLVAATGNDGHGPADHGLFYPAAFTGEEQYTGRVVAVGALRADRLGRACFSNYGEWVTVYEEGEKLINAFPFGRYIYREPVSKDIPPRCTYYHPPLEQNCTCVTAPPRFSEQAFQGMAAWSGTSFATPIVAARIARHMTEIPELRHAPREAAQDLFKQLINITDAGDSTTMLPVFPTKPVP